MDLPVGGMGLPTHRIGNTWKKEERPMKKKLLAGLLALCVVLALGLAACQSPETAATTTITTKADDNDTSAAEETPATWENLSWEKDTSPVTFECYIDFDWFSADTFGEDDVSQEITRLTGVTLNVTKASDNKVLGVLLAAQELPDLVQTDTLLQRFESEDVCYAWTKLIPEYCPELLELVDPLELINNQAADGNFYTLKNVYKDEKCYNDPRSVAHFGNFHMGYRQDIMEKLQLPEFTSIEELDETFYKVKEHASELELGSIYHPHPSWSDPLTYWMGCQPSNWWDTETKSIKTLWSDEAWLEYYKLMNKWYRDGILAADYLGIRPEDFFSRVNSATTFCYTYNQGVPADANSAMREAGIGGKYDDLSKPYYTMVVEPLAYKGDNTRWNSLLTDYSTGWAGTYISKNCGNPDRAICYMEFLKSPQGDELTFFGIEGKDWEWTDDGGIKYTQEKMDILASDPKHKFGNGLWYFMGSYWAEGMNKTIAIEYERSKGEEGKWQLHDLEMMFEARSIMKDISRTNKNPAMSFARVETSDEDTYAAYTKLSNYWSTQTAAMITADSESAVEQIWQETQDYLRANGLEAVEKAMTDNYVSNLKRYQEAGYFTDIITE